MDDNLIFYLVPYNDWKDALNSGKYHPDTLEENGFIQCFGGSQIEQGANRWFNGRDDLYMLVIDPMRVKENIKYEEPLEEGEKYPLIYGPLNTDAVIDKIRIHPDGNGEFSIQVE